MSSISSLISGFGRVLLCLGFASASAAKAQPISSAQFRQYKALNPSLERALKAVKEHHFDEAKAILKPCLDQIPDHFEAHYLMALMDFETRDFVGVLEHLDVSERTLARLDRDYREQVAQMKAVAEANVQEAKDNLAAAQSRNANATKTATLQRDTKSAESDGKPIQGLETPFSIPADYLFLRGNALLRLRRREEARSAYRKAVEMDASHTNAWNNLIALSLGSKDLISARADIARAEAAGVSIRPELKNAVETSR